MILRLASIALAVLASAATGAEVICHYEYGGESRSLRAAAVDSPYEIPAIAVGSYFQFRVVFRERPVDLAAVKVYVYADRDHGPTPIHQATYAYPPSPGGRHGFTGLHFVYEPVRDGELKYWCEMAEDAGR